MLAQGRGERPYPDEDLDGMDDVWELAHGADTGASDPWGDADGDGISNLSAFLAHRDAELAR